jgi:hypothetical protein
MVLGLVELIKNDREITYKTIALKLRAKFSIKASCATVRRSAMKMKWSKKSTRYCQILSEANKVKRMLYAGFHLASSRLEDSSKLA